MLVESPDCRNLFVAPFASAPRAGFLTDYHAAPLCPAPALGALRFNGTSALASPSAKANSRAQPIRVPTTHYPIPSSRRAAFFGNAQHPARVQKSFDLSDLGLKHALRERCQETQKPAAALIGCRKFLQFPAE